MFCSLVCAVLGCSFAKALRQSSHLFVRTQAGVQHRRVESPESVNVETMSLAIGPFRRKVEAKQLTRTRGLALHLLPFFVVKLIVVPYALLSAVPGTRFEISPTTSKPGRLLDIYLLHCTRCGIHSQEP